MDDNVIAIDGPAGSDKSTTARQVALRMNFAHLDSGALYRAVALAALEAGTDMEDGPLVKLARETPVSLGMADGRFYPAVRTRDVSAVVRSAAVTARVSQVAAFPGVRQWANSALRAAAAKHPRGVVCDGRDIGTVVFPKAKLKIFLTASVAERARRRALEMDGVVTAQRVDQLSREIAERDAADSSREFAPLVRAADAIDLDTTGMSFGDQVDQIVALARKVFG